MTIAPPWLRLKRGMLGNAKFIRLSLHQRGVLLTCLAATDGAGLLPPLEDVACHLGVGEVECRALLDDLLGRRWLVGVIIDGDARYVFKNWEEHQQASDKSTDRVRKFRAKSRCEQPVDKDASKPVEERHETVSSCFGNGLDKNREEKNITLAPSLEPAREKVKQLGFNVEIGRMKGMTNVGVTADPVSTLTKRAEGLGLPVDDLTEATNRAKPKNHSAYFTALCVKHLQQKLPDAPEALLRDALWGKSRDAYAAVTAMLVEEAA